MRNVFFSPALPPLLIPIRVSGTGEEDFPEHRKSCGGSSNDAGLFSHDIECSDDKCHCSPGVNVSIMK
jgi:hypothetical protein